MAIRTLSASQCRSGESLVDVPEGVQQIVAYSETHKTSVTIPWSDSELSEVTSQGGDSEEFYGITARWRLMGCTALIHVLNHLNHFNEIVCSLNCSAPQHFAGSAALFTSYYHCLL